jgi:hypothetical protein
MRNLLILIIAISLTGCHTKLTKQEQALQDTLNAIRKWADFKPLPATEANDFLNRYYLPRLDTLPVHRRIFVHPLKGTDFKQSFKNDSILLTAKYHNDTVKAHQYILELEGFALDNTAKWDAKSLANCTIVTDTLPEIGRQSFYNKYREEWIKKIKPGYMTISYPQYNPYSKSLLIKEFLIDGYWCGTGKNKTLWFKKVPGGWMAR